LEERGQVESLPGSVTQDERCVGQGCMQQDISVKDCWPVVWDFLGDGRGSWDPLLLV
jgi:hypothetical protein